jgi:uncharacterized protein YndB with AHSA1/START domain
MSVLEGVVSKSVRVEIPAERAFALYTAMMGRWWPGTHHIGKQKFETIVVEPRAGGRYFERDAAGVECDWGTVLAWEPPHRVVLSWHLGPDWKFDPDPEKASEVEVRFIPDGEGVTIVELEHRAIERHGEGYEKVRDAVNSPGGWTAILESFAASAQETK